ETLRRMEQDGTYASIYRRWFGDEVVPHPLGGAAAVAEAEAPAAEATAPAADGQAPREQAATSEPAAVEPGAGGILDVYEVQPGDTLSGIARHYYGAASATSWQRIYEANRDVYGDEPGRLRAGTTLQLTQ